MTNTNIFNLTGIGSNVRFGKAGSRLKMDGSVLTVRDNADAVNADFAAAAGSFSGNVTVTGNLTVNGTTTSVNSTVVTIVDPMINLGGAANGGAPTLDDGINRGVTFQYFKTSAKEGFFGWDNASGKFVFRPDGVNLGTAAFNQVEAGNVTITGNSITEAATISATGDITVTPTGGDLVLSSLSGVSALLFADASKKVKSTPILWDGSALTVNNLTLSGSTVGTTGGTGDITLTPSSGKNVIVSSLTATQVLFAGASKELAGNSTFTFNNATGLLSATAVTTTSDVTVGGNLTVSTLTAGQVPYVGVAGLISNSSSFTWDNTASKLTAANLAVTTDATVSGNLTVSTLTAGRLTFAGAAGKLVDSASLTWDSATGMLTAANVTVSTNATVSGNLTVSTLTAGQVTFAGVAGVLTNSSSFTWDNVANKLTAANLAVTTDATVSGNLTVSTLTATRVPFAGAAGILTDSSALTFTSGTSTLTTTNGSFGGNLTVTSSLFNTALTAGRVVFSKAAGELTDSASLSYDSGTGTLTIGNVTVSGNTIASTSGDVKIAPASNVIDVSNARITNLADPTGPADAVTKSYMDAQIGTGSKIALETLATAATVTQSIVGNVHRIKVYVTSAYSAGATISISDGSNTVVAVADVDAQTVGAYIVDMFGAYETATTFTLSIGGSPAAGAGYWLTEYFTTAA